MRRLIALMLVVSAVLIWPGIAKAAAVEVTLHRISADGVGESIGTVSACDSDQGLEIIPSLSGPTPGEHGFHLHANGSCDSAANADGAMVAGWVQEGIGILMRPANTSDRSAMVTAEISAVWW